MTTVADFSGNAALDPETVKLTSEAYGLVIQALHDRGQPQLVKEIIAKRILELAGLGERDPKHLCLTVLSELGLPPETE